MIFGFEAEVNQLSELREGRQIDLRDGSSTNTIIGEVFPIRDFPNTDIFEAGFYIHDEIKIRNSRITIIPALRFEIYELDPQRDEIFLEDFSNLSVTDLNETNFSPKVGILYRMNDKVDLFGQYSRGFRSPPFEDVNIGLENPFFNYRAIPNPDLNPETSDGVEFGGRIKSEYAHTSLSFHYTDYKNLIESRVNLGPDPETDVLIFQSQNRADAEIYGFLFKSSYDLGAVSEKLSAFEFNTAFAYTRGTDKSEGQPLNSINPAKAVLGLQYDAPNGKWGAELVSTLVAEKDRVDESNDPLFKTPGFGILDLVGYLKMSDSTYLSWGIFNLTDKKYWEWSDVGGRSVDDPDLELFTRPGINASVSLNLHW